VAMLVLLGVGGLAARGADVALYGTTYRPLTDVAQQYGMTMSWLTPNKTMSLRSKNAVLDFTVNERQMHMNYEPVAFGSPVILYKGGMWIAKRDYDKNIVPLLAPRTLPDPPPLHRIVIDPGHGGKDPGGENPALKLDEKTNTLDVSLRLAQILQKQGYAVTLTRRDDHFVELKDRTAIANAAHGDLFVCIHFNIAADPTVSGIETWVMTPPGEPSSTRSDLEAGDKVVDPENKFDLWNAVEGFSAEWALTKKVGAANRGLKRARYNVLTDLQMPGMLIECGFLTNPTEGRKIATAAYRQQLAQGIADGVAMYADSLAKTRVAQAPQTKAAGSTMAKAATKPAPNAAGAATPASAGH